jgi:GTP pyrophosphokinase
MGSFTPEQDLMIQERFEELMKICEETEKCKNLELIRKAFNIANEAHRGMLRKSGEPYIIHPLEVAKVVAKEIGLGTTSVVCSLLHDTVEDTDLSLDFIRTEFGEKCASIIDGLTKMSNVFDNNSSLQAENFRKMLLTLSDDLRVILIKLADRLHNMRTLYALPPNKQIKIAGETVYLYAPMAHRLGLYSIKQELEDLSLKYRHPKIYTEIVNRLEASSEEWKNFYDGFVIPLNQALDAHGFKYEISGRKKSIYSIYYKMQHKGIPFEEIYDLVAVRIVFDPTDDASEKKQCWDIYSIITDIYTPKMDRIRDWISTPKANGYEALHITVMGPKGRWVEVQIRSRRMDEIAERGFAAHWKYKHNQETLLDKWISNIREALSNPSADALEFLDEFKLNLFSYEIQVFTPKGDIVTLPKGAIALDFAYEIHSKIGKTAIAAKVNHKLVSLNQILKSGDQIEILTSDKQKSQAEWIDQVVTAKAKSCIKADIRADVSNKTEVGYKKLEEKLKELNINPNARILRKLITEYKVSDKNELYSKIGRGIIPLDNLDKVLRKNSLTKFIRYWELQFFGVKEKKALPEKEDAVVNTAKGSTKKGKSQYVVKDMEDESEREFRLAKCCNPIPGDDVIGYREKEGVIIIHKSRCPNAVKISSSHGENVLDVKWTTYKVRSFLARIFIQGLDRFGILSEIITTLTNELNVNIRTLHVTSHDGIFEGTIDLYIHDSKNLYELITKIKKIKGIERIRREEILDPSQEKIG